MDRRLYNDRFAVIHSKLIEDGRHDMYTLFSRHLKVTYSSKNLIWLDYVKVRSSGIVREGEYKHNESLKD